MTKQFQYETCCVNVPSKDVPALQAMIDSATDITRGTFRRHCLGLDEWAEGQGYEKHPKQGLILAGGG